MIAGNLNVAGDDWTPTGHEYIGYSGIGTFIQSGGTHTLCNLYDGNLYLGYNSGSIGTYNLSDNGLLTTTNFDHNTNVDDIWLGFSGTGTFYQSGGTVSLISILNVAYNTGSKGSYFLSGVGTLRADYQCVAYSGVGIFGQSGGTNSAAEILLGGDFSGKGKYSLSGGQLFAGTESVGCVGAGTITQTGGTNSVSGPLFLGYSPKLGWTTGSGVYCLASAACLSATNEYIGYNSFGTALFQQSGGTNTTVSIAIGSGGLYSMVVGHGCSLVVGSGGITNNGKVRMLAGAGVATGGTFTPISAGTWGGTGTFQAIGGTLNTSNHQFTVSAIQTGISGTTVGINLASIQRVLVSNGGSTLGASFLMKSTSTPLTFTATAASGGTLTALENMLGTGQSILGAWNFKTVGGYMAGDPAYLSFGVGTGRSTEDLEVWRYNGSIWSPFDATDLTYDGNYASFTVTDLNGFAMTTIAIPEPSTLFLLGISVIGLLGYAWRRRRPSR